MANQALKNANNSSGSERQRLLLKSAQLFYHNSNFKAASKVLSYITPTASLHRRANLLAARIALAQNNPERAITLVPQLSDLKPVQKIQATILLANINASLGYAMKAVKARVNLGPSLKTDADKRKNNEQIWSALSAMPTTRLNHETSADTRIQAWLDLARIMRGFTAKGQSNVNNIENAILNWGTRYPQQTVSNEFLSHLIDAYITTAEKVKTIAVLLPQQGRFSGAAETIINGLLSAYYADNHSTTRPTLRFYNTGNTSIAFSQLFQQAIDDGATNIIGPLNKTLINQLALQHDLDIPVLTLNYGENTHPQTANLFQFGLSPEGEARQVAELAIRQGRRKAVELVPDSSWGHRLQTAFSQYFTALGGTVVNTQDYANSTADYSRPIQRLFNLDQSAARHRRIENTLGEKLKFMPYRRQDVDMVFIAASYRAARSIIPALKFYHAGSLPVYSTSNAYTGTPDKDRDIDLDGLIFCDMPWVLEDNAGSTSIKNGDTLKQTFIRNWPNQQHYTRLFALGVDAYHLVFNLEYLHENTFAHFSGGTGNLQLDKFGRIKRTLLWAKFINGLAVHIEPEIKLDNGPDKPINPAGSNAPSSSVKNINAASTISLSKQPVQTNP